MLDSSPFEFAAPSGLIREALRSYLPREQVSVSDHAAANRWLDNRGGGYVGRWSHEEAPYLVGPMDALTSRDYVTVAVPGPARSGKTTVGENWMLQSVNADPADMLWYGPTDDAVKSYVKRVIEPMIELHPSMREKLGTLPRDRSLSFKRFQEMWVEFLGVAESTLINKSAGRIVLDEMDACWEAVGDVYSLADQRRQTFGLESMVLGIGHPDLAEGTDPAKWTRGIMRLYARSDRRTWWWPCPQCNGFSSTAPIAERVMVLDYPEDAPLDEIVEAARLICPLCGHPIEDKHRRAMNLDGRWAGLGQAVEEDGTIVGTLLRRDVAGFWILGVMSPFIIGGIGALARDLVEAKRHDEATGETSARGVAAKRLGIPAEPAKRVGSISAETLAERADPGLELGRVPPGVRFLTAWADVQNNRFEILVRGWGVGAESWIVDMLKRPADPPSSAEDWDALLKWLGDLEYPLADGSGRVMRLRGAGFDGSGAAGVTDRAYAAWRKAMRLRVARMRGIADGREAWNLIPTKGHASTNAVRLQVRRPDSARNDRRARAQGAVPLALFGANLFKDDLGGQLGRADPGPGYVHFPAALLSKEPPHLFFEQLVAERRKASGAWEKVGGARNEALDLMVGTHVIAHLHGLARVDWTHPPVWAAEWDKNSLVGAGRPPTDAFPATVSASATAAVRPQAPTGASDRLSRLISRLAH